MARHVVSHVEPVLARYQARNVVQQLRSMPELRSGTGDDHFESLTIKGL